MRAPAVKNLLHLPSNGRARLVSLPAANEECVISSVGVPDMGSDRKLDRLGFEALGGGRAPNPAGVPQARMLRNGGLFGLGTTGIKATDRFSKASTVLRIETGLTLRGSLAGSGPPFLIGQTLPLGARESSLLDENTLPFVALSGAAKPDHDRSKRRVLARPPGERRFPPR